MQVSQQRIKNLEFNGDSPNENQFIGKFFAFLQLYWYPQESEQRSFPQILRSWGMVILLLIFLVALVSLNAFNSFVFRDLIDVIENRNLTAFRTLLALYAVSLIASVFLTGFSGFIRKLIALDWHQWLNHKILHQYFRNKAYYKINFKSDIENADQRLGQEIEPIARTTMNFLATCLEKIMEMLLFLAVLWSISHAIAIVLLIYTIIGNFISLYITQQINKINEEKLEVEADYSYGITHVRNHAESIAFFRGEEPELNMIEERFSRVVKTIYSKIDWERSQELFNRGYQAIIDIFPFLIVAPLYIAGRINFGEVNQASYACYFFANALSDLVKEFANSGQFITYIERFDEFYKGLEKVTKQPESLSTIKVRQQDHIAFDSVTLQTPDYEKVIVENLSMSVETGKGLLIVGPSGRGKSSLLRAISGLWNSGTGYLLRPPIENISFLPQRPYIILGSLREQLLYPDLKRSISQPELEEVLEEVNLRNVLTKVDSFDKEVPWENILSLGEQQRLAFARLLVNPSNFIILDEATSALDLKNEENLYKKLQQSGKTFISVGHRESLFNYHDKVLELTGDSSWRLVDMKDYAMSHNGGTKSDHETVTNEPQPSSEPLAISAEIEIIEIETHEPENPPNPLETSAEIEIIDLETDEPETPTESSETPTEGLSHQEMQALTSYSLNTIRNKASKGKTIKTKEGSTYRYNKDPKILKWMKV